MDKLVITRLQGKICTASVSDRKVTGITLEEEDKASILNNIYIGKVQKVVTGINAAFVDLGVTIGYYSLDENKEHLFTQQGRNGKLRPGDEILVQVSRDAVKTKAPVLTANLSLPGRFCVLTAGKTGIGFSAKLTDTTWKNQIRKILPEKEFEDFGIIIRTNARSGDPEQILEECETLKIRLKQLLKESSSRTCYSCLYRPASPYLMEIRDTYTDQFDTIITDDRQLYEETADFLKTQYPEELSRLQFYEDPRVSLSNLYGLSAKLKEATETRVWLKSGGYLVIEPTEALTVIDVNSGKYSGKKGIRDTFRMINREAALEIARQLRLRNLSGIILVDFINMEEADDRQELLEFLSAQLKRDPVKTALIDMTPLGLVEITRKKIRRPLKEQLEQ